MYEKLLRNIVLFNQWRKKHISQDNFLIMAAAFVGLIGGFMASVLKKLVHLLADYLQNGVHWQYKYYLFFFFPLVGIFLTIVYLKTFIKKRPFYSGIPPLIRSVSRERSKIDFHNIYSQVISSALTVGMGGSAGLEAPAASSGAAAGSNVGRLFGLDYRETTMLLACGGAAGISAAFGSPVAGMVFALEVLLPAFSIPAFIPLLMSSAVAFVISKMMHSAPLFVYVTDSWQTQNFWFYVLFGIVAGFYTIFYSYVNESVPKVLGKIKGTYNKALAGGITLGLLVTFFPAIYGEGYIAIQELLNGNYQSLLANSFFPEYQNYAWAIIMFAAFSLIGKTYGCVITMSSGGNGGMFGPSVGIGGLLGFVFAFALNQTGWVQLNVTHFIIAGMAASVSGAMHAPLTGVFLAAEITGGYVLIVPLMVVSAIAYLINKGIRKYSIYTLPLAQKGSLVDTEDKDASVLSHLKLGHLVENDFVILAPDDTPASREEDIVHADRQAFPVVGKDGKLLGVIIVDQLLEHIVSDNPADKNMPVTHIMQQAIDKVNINTPMKDVLQVMDKRGIRILPVVDGDDKYIGFVTKTGIFNKYRRLLVRQNDLL